MNFAFGSKSRAMLESMLASKPAATAQIRGDAAHKDLRGTVTFVQLPDGVLVRAEATGLPLGGGPCGNSVFGFHIHAGKSCTGNADDAFADTGGHYNPGGCPHPQHAGDLPPLFADKDGFAWQAFYTTRFRVEDILGRTVVIHAHPDDFHTQPAGNSGAKIGCGIVKR